MAPASLITRAVGLQFDNTLGAAFIGLICSTLVFGIFTAQVYRYYRRFPRDKRAYKCLVGVLWALVLIDQMFISHAVYTYAVKDYANPASLVDEPVVWSLIVQITAGSIVGAIVKICFAMRVWRFSRRNVLLAGTNLLLILVQLSFATAYTTQGFEHHNLPLAVVIAIRSQKLWATLSLSFGSVTDIVTASALTYYLSKMRTGYQKSDNIVLRLTAYAVSTGFLTSAASLATLILYNSMPDNFIFMGVYFVVSKLYAVSLMATPNTRTIVGGRGTENDSGTSNRSFGLHQRFGSGSQGFRQHLLGMEKSLPRFPNVQVGVHREVSVVSELPKLP